MVETLHREYLKKLIEKKGKNDTGKALDVLPFLTKRTRVMRSQFNNVLGDFIRNISGLKIDEKVIKNNEFYLSTEEHALSEYIANEVEFPNDDDRYDLIRFLNQYLFNQADIKPIHPYVLNFIKVDKSLKNESGKYAQFMNEVLVRKNLEIKQVFQNKESEDILTELILSKMDAFKSDKEHKTVSEQNNNNQYQPLFESLSNLFQEDLIYLSKYKDYFLASFPLLTHYYVFMYACQLLIKFEQFTEADFDKIHPLYFALEWESITKRRMAADDLEGFKYIKEKSTNLFPHIHTISHLSHCSLNEDPVEEQDKIAFIPYNHLFQLIKDKGEEYEADFLKELKQWISEYSILMKKEVVDDSNDIPSAFKVLFNCLREGTSKGVSKKFGENIEDLGSQFIKSRGSLGQVLNVKHDFLLLITAVSVKDKRIPLNDLFLELEKRGLAFDRYSKKEIVKLFDNHNILDKKSDSGDAQYVKPIL